MKRAVVGNDAVLTQYLYAADDETLTDATGDVTVTVAREDGTALTGGTATKTVTGTYTFTLTAATHLTRVDELKVTFSATVSGKTQSHDQYVKVVKGRYFTLAELRAMKGLSSTSTFPNADLATARDIAEDFVEQFCEAAFVPQYRREVVDGDDRDELYLSRLNVRELLSVKLDGSAMTTTGWTVSSSGRIKTDGDVFICAIAGQNVQVQYEYGSVAPPMDLKNATLKLARALVLSTESAIPDRARMMQTEWGMFQLDVASKDKPTGIPDVDAVLMRYREEQPGWVIA